MHRRLVIDPLIGKAAAIYPDIETGSFENLITDLFPAPAHRFDFTGPVLNCRVGVAPKPSARCAVLSSTDAHDSSALAVPVRGMDREVDRDAIPLCEGGGVPARASTRCSWVSSCGNARMMSRPVAALLRRVDLSSARSAVFHNSAGSLTHSVCPREQHLAVGPRFCLNPHDAERLSTIFSPARYAAAATTLRPALRETTLACSE